MLFVVAAASVDVDVDEELEDNPKDGLVALPYELEEDEEEDDEEDDVLLVVEADELCVELPADELSPPTSLPVPQGTRVPSGWIELDGATTLPLASAIVNLVVQVVTGAPSLLKE